MLNSVVIAPLETALILSQDNCLLIKYLLATPVGLTTSVSINLNSTHIAGGTSNLLSFIIQYQFLLTYSLTKFLPSRANRNADGQYLFHANKTSKFLLKFSNS